MAPKKSARKTSAKKPLKSKSTAKKKTATNKGKATSKSKSSSTKKKRKTVSSLKVSKKTKDPKKVAKASAKKRTRAKAATGKKKVGAKKSASKKRKATTKKTVIKTVSKPKAKRKVKKKWLVQKRRTSIAKKKVKSRGAKKSLQKSMMSSAPAVQRLPKSKEPLLSSTERYNIGGLFVCAIERQHDPDCSRLRAAFSHLDLSSQEKDNLIRLSEGIMIPKLFAESLAEQKVNQLLADLVKFGLAQGSYERYWREEIQQIGFWLGVFPAQFQAIEQQVQR